MNIAASLATLTLFVYYAVTFTKQLIGKLSSDPATSNTIVRLWALVLGLVGASLDYFMTTSAYTRLGVYTELKLGAAAAIGAIITYHIGQTDFIGAFGGDTTAATTPATLLPVNSDFSTLQHSAIMLVPPTAPAANGVQPTPEPVTPT